MRSARESINVPSRFAGDDGVNGMDKFKFIYDRFAKFWLPHGEETGDAERDVMRMLNRAHEISGKAARRITSGLAVIEPQTTLAVITAKPVRNLPEWIDIREKIEKPRVYVNGLLANPPDAPSVILVFGKPAFSPNEIRINEGTVVHISEAGKGTFVDTRRVSQLAGLIDGHAKKQILDARRWALERDAGEDLDRIDQQLEKIRTSMKVGSDAFNDLLDALIETTETEFWATVRRAEALASTHKAA